METIQLKSMTYAYSSYYKPVFENVDLMLSADWKLGLIGRNGRGKTTLLNLIHGNLKPDGGTISKTVHTEIFPYTYSRTYTKTIDLIKDNIGPYFELENEMENLLKQKTEQAYLKYADVLNAYNDLNGYEVEAMIEREFNLMDLPVDLLNRPFETLSGGEKTKALIIALFLRPNFFLLLDEPTNHLDMEGKDTLARYLSKKKGFIIVSHDRQFLDKTVDHILSINKGDIAIEKGNFSSWNLNRLRTESFELARKAHIEKEVKAMERAAKESRRFSHNKEQSKIGSYDKGFVGARAARLMKRAKNIEKRQSKQLEEKKALLKNYEDIPRLVIKQEETSSKHLVKISELSFSFDEKVLFSKVSLTIELGDRLWIRGTNGTGKSTLLNILRGRLKGYEGHIKLHSDLMIAESYQDALWQEGDLRGHLGAHGIDETVYRHVLDYFDMHDDYFERPLETFSQGELKKIDIARALTVKNHLIIMDEPLNYMDIFFREQLEKAILHYKPTLIFVEHDGHFSQRIATKTLTLKGKA